MRHYFRAFEEDLLFLRHPAMRWKNKNQPIFARPAVHVISTGTIFFMHHAEH